MIRYLIRRILWAVVLFFAVTVVSYVLFFIIPANPAKQACGQACTTQDVKRVAHALGTDRPIYVQYGKFIKRLVIDRSLGHSYFTRQPVNTIVGAAAPVTASLVVGGAILWMLIAIPIGILSALRPRSLLDRASMTFVLIGISAHPVWIGLIFAYVFGFRLHITPITGYCDFINPSGDCGGPVQWAYHLVLPWLTFAILFAALYVRMIRANVMETLNEDYVRTARAKGAPEWLVMRSHVLRNALLPVVTMLGMDIGVALGGAIFTESVSGKSVTCLTIMGLNLKRSAMSSGTAMWKGEDLLTASPRRLREIRGNEIAMIFQDPMTSLNPVHKIGDQLAEAMQLHEDVSRKTARARALELLKAVGIPRPERRLDDYPHQFSGGMRQRVMIAMALINNPDLLIADEPTTALDVTTQAQILTLIEQLQEEFGSAVIMITHDLGVVAEIADDVVVMYAAEVAEKGAVGQIFKKPHHPYTWGLMGSLPRLDADVERLVQIQGQPPSLLRPPSGCRFHPRCPYVMSICKQVDPVLSPVTDDPEHLQACHLDEETKDREAAKLLAGMMAEAS